MPCRTENDGRHLTEVIASIKFVSRKCLLFQSRSSFVWGVRGQGRLIERIYWSHARHKLSRLAGEHARVTVGLMYASVAVLAAVSVHRIRVCPGAVQPNRDRFFRVCRLSRLCRIPAAQLP